MGTTLDSGSRRYGGLPIRAAMQAERQSRHLTKEELVTSLLLQGLDDELQLWWIIGEVAIDYLGLSPAEEDDQAVMGPTLEVISELLEPGYFVAGDAVLNDDGTYYIRPWELDMSAAIKRIEKEWRELPESPNPGDVVWLELTDAGQEEARSRGSFPKQSAQLPSMPRDPDHWGQTGQEDIFPPGTKLELRPYRTHKPSWDHDHCIFCWAKLMDPELSEASLRAVKNDPEILTSGYSAAPVGGEWVCPSCFGEFAERFGWKVEAD